MRLIDADALKNHKFLTPNAVEAEKWLPKETKAYQKGWNDAIDAIIDNAPTVTIKEWKEEMPIYIKDAMLEALRPQGEWIKEEDRVYSKCSLCGFKYADYGILFDYCPNCGADMRGDRE